MYFTPSELERKVNAFRNSLQRRMLIRGKTKMSNSILRKLSILSALCETEETLCDTAQIITMILATAFGIKIQNGELFTFSISGGGYHFAKRKALSVIVAYAAAMADGFIEVKIKSSNLSLKFNSKIEPQELDAICRKMGWCLLRVRENNDYILNVSLTPAKIKLKSEICDWMLQSYIPDIEAIICSVSQQLLTPSGFRRLLQT